jgi:aspartyl protease family protein
MLKPWIVIACLTIAFAPILQDETRKWTSADGQYVMEAQLIDQTDGEVTLKKSDGSTVKVAISKLSDSDQRYLRQAAMTPDIEAHAREALSEKGIKISSSGVSLTDENDIAKKLREAGDLEKALAESQEKVDYLKAVHEQARQNRLSLMQQNVILNAQLANVPPNNASQHNRLVAAVNANVGQINLLQEQLIEFEKSIDEAHAQSNREARAFADFLAELRKLTDQISQRYRDMAADPEIQSSLEEYNQATGRKLAIAESRTFQSYLKRLVGFEASVLSESISLKKAGGTFHVDVVFENGHEQEMVVDSGASLVTLPWEIAQKCGIKTSDADQELTMQIADGSRIKGRLVKLKSLRVGNFEVQDIDCAVLGPEATNAPPLLGMSFLGNFNFELNAQESTLTLLTVRTDEGEGKK